MDNFVDLDMIKINKESLELVPKELCEKYTIFPYNVLDNTLYIIAYKKPLSDVLIKIRFISKKSVDIVYGDKDQIDRYIEIHYEDLYRNEALRDMIEGDILFAESQVLDNITGPIISLVDSIIGNAILKEASDIHIEPFKINGIVRYRIDGVLNTVDTIPKNTYDLLCARIKIMSHMDIACKFNPQSGNFSKDFSGINLDFRVSTLPTIHGEKIVIRILRKDLNILNVDNLGFSKVHSEVLKNILGYNQGLILITGPTGSGKSTTIYSLIKEINKGEKNIVTMEEPVEYEIPGVNQVNLSRQGKLTFSNILKSVLRQDPDVIMVGEIIDKDTAEIAIKAAFTGHLVLTTLHTSDASGAINRLVDMGIPNHLIKDALTVVIAQRLCRKICDACRVEYISNEEEVKLLDLRENVTLYKGLGCRKCNNTGYKGRTISYEIILINDLIKEKVIHGFSSELKKVAIENGMVTLSDNFKNLVLDGITTVNEYKSNIQIFNMEGAQLNYEL